MKNLFFALIVLWGQSVFANAPMVPKEFLAEGSQEKSNAVIQEADFSESVDHMMNVQEETLEKIPDNHAGLKLTQLLTSFSVSKSGIFGLSSLSTSSATTLFWTKKTAPALDEGVKSFVMNENDDELSLQMKVDEISDYLVREGKVKDSVKLRDNLDKALRKGKEVFEDMNGLKTANWYVGGFRLDLAITVSGTVLPFTKLGENVRLWIEWTKPAPVQSEEVALTHGNQFVANVLSDVEEASSKIVMPKFELQSLYVGLGQDYKSGFLGFGAATWGFVGYVRLARKPKVQVLATELPAESQDQDYPVIHEPSDNKSNFASISRRKIRTGIQSSLKFANFFANRAERKETTHWELSNIREIATISKSGFFGLSNVTTRGVFIFMLGRKKPQLEKSVSFVNPLGTLSLIRLCFTTQVGYNIPGISKFELRPHVELFWR